jgi:hypothetical protein
MTDEDLIEGVVDVVRREMGPIGLIARVEITKAIRNALFEFAGWQLGGWDDDDGDDPLPDDPLPPDDGPKVDLHKLLDLDVVADTPLLVPA